MSNTLLTLGKITRESMALLENELTFAKMVNREYSDQFAVAGAKVGDTVNVRKPPRYVGRRSSTLSPESSTETSVPVTIGQPWGCDITFTSREMTLDIDDYSDRFLKPIVATVANMIDFDGLQLYKKVYNVVGTGGTTPASMDIYLQGGELLDNEAVPKGSDRSVVMNPRAQRVLVGADRALFNPGSVVAGQYRTGNMADNSNGFNWSMDQNIALHTVGTYAAAAGAVTLTSDTPSGSTIITGGWTSGDLLAEGDVFTIAGVYAINPQNRQSTGLLRNFRVTAVPTAASGGGAMTIAIEPALVFSGKDQTVYASGNKAAATSVITIKTGTSALQTPQNLIFHKDAFTLATVDMYLPKSVVEVQRIKSKKLGISMRMLTAYDVTNDREYTRLDVLGAWACLRPELAVRALG